MSSLVFQEKKHFQGFVDFISLSLMLHSYSLLLTYIHWFPDYCRTTMVSSKLKTKAPETSLLHPYMKYILQLVSPSNCTTLDNQGCIARSFTLETSSITRILCCKMYYGMVQCLKNSVPSWVFLKDRTSAEWGVPWLDQGWENSLEVCLRFTCPHKQKNHECSDTKI